MIPSTHGEDLTAKAKMMLIWLALFHVSLLKNEGLSAFGPTLFADFYVASSGMT